MIKKYSEKINNKALKIAKILSHETDLKKLIDTCEVISFDIFDTVIVRKVLEPTDIYIIVENLYVDRFGVLSFQFSDVRCKAESIATQIANERSGVQSIGLDAIYEYICQTNNLEQETSDRLKAIEIETELKFSVKNEYMYSFYQYCLESNKKVVFTSDMYLPEKVITKILQNSGYTEFHKLYLSSVVGESKSNGALYRYLLNDLSCQPSQILHVGGDHYADVINSMKNKIHSFYYQKSSDYAFQNPQFKCLRELYSADLSIEESIYFALIINKFFTQRQSDNDILWYDFGYIYCGIIYFGFIRWLTDQLIDQKIDKAFFLARDGYIMNKVYRLINQGKNAPLSEYMYASRRSINIPTISHYIDESSMKILCNIFPNLNVEHYLSRLQIDGSKYTKEINKVGFSSKDHKIESVEDKHKLSQLFHLLSEEVCTISAKERDNLVKYLIQIDFMKAGKIAIVDIGWQGTMQNSLNELMKLLNKTIDINGYYLGTFETAQKFVDNGFSMSGYACQFAKPSNNYKLMSRCVPMFEFIFSAPHGSVINFTNKNGKIEPVCEDNKQYKDNSEVINEFHTGALDFINDYMEVEKDYRGMNVEAESALKPIERLLNHPTYQESVHYGNLKHSEFVGKNTYTKYFAKVTDSKSIFFNPIKFKKAYDDSLWKVGFRKRYIGHILPEKVFSSLKKLKG